MSIEKDYFEKNAIAIIEPTGYIHEIERKEGEFCHKEVFDRAQKQIPDLLDGYVASLAISSGFDLSCFVAAKGNIVLWPSSITTLECILISLPIRPNNTQIDELKEFLDTIKDLEIYAAISNFSSKNKVTTRTLSVSEDPSIRYDNLMDYLKRVEEINNKEQELQMSIDKEAKVNVDVRAFKKKN